MKRPAAAWLGCIAVVLLIAVVGVATIPSVPTGTWQPMGSMAVARSGAASVLLQDHRVLITGGSNGTDAVNSAEVFNVDGSFANVSAMGTPRSGHVAVLLRDERVLVAGGVTAGGGATNSAEIYDPNSDSWTVIAGGMAEARSKATATLLPDGRVLFAGGQNGSAPSSALEIFDPNTEQFSFAGSLSSPRMGLASASLADGRVLITGGSNGNVPVATVDVFDPTTNTVYAGPAMTSPRVGHSATSLLDGRVLIAGGNNGSADLASAEVFDPAIGEFAAVAATLTGPRQGQAAVLLPNNNAVLIIGGTSAENEVATAETFTPWTGAFAQTGSPIVSRQEAAVSALNQDGLLLMAGGSSAGKPVSSAELYSFQTLRTDKPDYPPGTNVTITGSGWTPGETVTLTLVESPLVDTHGPYTAVVQADGTFTNNSFTTDEEDFAIHFTLTAVGSISQAQAQTTFWDNKNLTVNFAGTGSGSITSTGGSGTINCTDSSGTASGPSCSDSFGNTDTVTLTETPTAPALFGGWNVTGGATIAAGTCTASSLTCTFGMNNNAITVIATFNPGPAAKYLVSASDNNPAAGSQVTITAQLADSGANPVRTAGKVVTWSKTGAGGSFSAATSNTNANGIATVNFTTGAVAGTVYTFTATDNSNFTGTSGNVLTVAGPLAQLVFTQQPTSTVAGVAVNPAVQVQLQDANGNVLTNDNGTNVAIAIQTNPGAGTLSGTTPVADSSGVATFSDLSINKIGTGYTLRANRGGTAVISVPFNITGRATATSVVLSPTSVQQGGSSQVTVSVADSGAGTQSNPAGTVALSSSDVGPNGDTFTTCTLAPSGANAASCTATVTTHEVGSSPHTITATYTATDNVHGGSNGSAGLTVVNPATTTSVTSSSVGNSSVFGDAVTFTATVASGSATPTGSVTFVEGSTCPGLALTGNSPNPVALSAGQASFTTAALSAGSHLITACFSPTGNFTASSGGVTQNVNQATPTITWANPADISYGTALSGTQLNATASGPGTFVYTPAAGTVLNAGNGQTLHVVFTPTDTTNYTMATKDVNINVNQKPVTASITASDKPYDGNSTADITSCTIPGKVGTDDVGCTASNGTFASANASPNPQTVTATVALTGATAGNYSLSSATATTSAKITPKPVTATLTAEDKAYDSTATEPNGNMLCSLPAGSAVGTDDVSCAASNGTFNSAQVALANQVTATVALTGTSSGNYSLTSTTAMATAHIKTAALAATLTAADKIYDGGTTEPDSHLSCTVAPVFGSDTVNCAAASGTFNSKDVATATTVTATVTISGTSASNYTLGAQGTLVTSTSATATAHIKTAPLTATLSAMNKMYDGGMLEPDGKMSCTVSPVFAGDVVSCTATNGSFNSKDVLTATTVTATVAIGGASASNYTLGATGSSLNSTSATAAAQITPAPLTIQADNKTKVFGQPVPALTATYNTLLGTDTPASLGGTLICTTSITTLSTVGSYPNSINCSGQTSANYTITYQPGSFTVTQASTTVVITSSADPSVLNAPVTFTAAVIPQFGGTATGTVTFTAKYFNAANPVTIGTGTLNGAGVATLTFAGLPVNANLITALYNGDANFTGSNMSMTQTVRYLSGGMCAGDAGHQILQPINADGTSIFNSKSTSPAKFRVCDANGVSIGTAGVVTSFSLVQYLSGTVATVVNENVDSTTPDIYFRWDPSAQQWIFNISNKGLYGPNRTYYFGIQLNDGSAILFNYGLK